MLALSDTMMINDNEKDKSGLPGMRNEEKMKKHRDEGAVAYHFLHRLVKKKYP